MITDRLIEKIIQMQNPPCVGLDTLFDYLPDDMKAGVTDFNGVAERVVEFNKKIIDSVYDIVPSVKVQIAYYEMYGVAGMKAYEETLKYAAEKGLVVIADAKRNDIGSTAACYAKTFLGETAVNEKSFAACDLDSIEEPMLKKYLKHELFMMFGISIMFTRLNKTDETDARLEEMWENCKKHDEKLAKHYRYCTPLFFISIPGKFGRALSTFFYRCANKVVRFN